MMTNIVLIKLIDYFIYHTKIKYVTFVILKQGVQSPTSTLTLSTLTALFRENTQTRTLKMRFGQCKFSAIFRSVRLFPIYPLVKIQQTFRLCICRLVKCVIYSERGFKKNLGKHGYRMTDLLTSVILKGERMHAYVTVYSNKNTKYIGTTLSKHSCVIEESLVWKLPTYMSRLILLRPGNAHCTVNMSPFSMYHRDADICFALILNIFFQFCLEKYMLN